jgi:NADPH-dependent glutamate synthase beta subunit-like oxidoreductase
VHEDVTDFAALAARYRAVFLACGPGPARAASLPGERLEGVLQAEALLEAVNGAAAPAPLEGATVVLGGGNTAVDAASAALRLGAQPVVIAYRRREAEMPAWLEHRRFALDEGVQARFLLLPVEILGEAGRVTGVRLQHAEPGAPDASGRCRPVPVDGAFETIECRRVVLALGNEAAGQWRALGLEAGPDGPRVDPQTMETSVPGLYAGGDLVNGGATVVQAVADGRRAARAIARRLAG